MRTETKIFEIYTFDELSEKVKEKVIEKNWDINTYDDWYELILENFKVDNTNYFEIGKIYFSGFHSQGDGAMFEYNDIYSDLFLDDFLNTLSIPKWKKIILKNCVYISGKGTQSGHYYHEKSIYHSIYIEDKNNGYYSNINNLIESFSENLESFIIEKYEDLARELYKNLNDYYDELTIKEAIIETIKENKCEFFENGEIY